MPKTKIIATLGPASSTSTVLRKMMHAGLDVARLNFSHGTHREHQARIELIRQLNRKYRRRIQLLGDLEGHRIRIGSLAKPIGLKKGQTFFLTQEEDAGSDTTVAFDYAGDLRDIKAGRYIYIDDGTIALKVEKSSARAIKTKVVVGGMLKEHKGVNIPEVTLRFSDLSKQDKEDISFCLKHKLDYIAQSFVRTKGDILAVKALLGRNTSCKVIAKIENQEGINNIDEIIDVSDGIMVARGDLGVSLPIYQVPVIQKIIIKKCNQKKKLVITATQMLESMVENIRPTRAEVSDVANAIIDGTDFVMLSAESAVGKYPSQTVKMMNQVIVFTENYLKR